MRNARKCIGLAAIAAITLAALSLTACPPPDEDGTTQTVSKTLVSIAVTAQPTKTQYNIGDTTLDTAGMVVTATYSDGTKAAVTGYTTSGLDSSTKGNKTITVTYEGKTATFTVNVIDSSLATVETPTATPPAGTYTTAQSVTLTADTGAAIYYTTNGTDPTTASALYSGAISVTATTTIKAFAVKEGMNDSGIMTAVYTISGGSQTPVADDYTVGNLTQTAGSVTAVTITPKDGKSTGTVSNIKYAGSATIPQTAGTYAVTFDVAAATGWNSATNLSAGTLTVKAVDYTAASVAELGTWLASKPDNTAATAYTVALNVNDVSNVKETLNTNNTKYVYLDLSGSTITTVPENAFFDSSSFPFSTPCATLTGITIPNSVTSIGNNAFQSCTGLASVNIPDSVTSIGDSAFFYCTSLTSVTIPNSVTSIGNNVFVRCTSLASINIPNSVTSIGNYAFSNCTGLTSITIPTSVTSIGNGAFGRCTSLTSIIIPDSVTSIGSNDGFPNSGTFQGCTSLTSVTIGNGVTSIGKETFYECSNLTSINIPNSVTSIEEKAFYQCASLTSINIPNSVTSIGEYVFSGCISLTSITIPNSVTSISGGTFYQCTSLTSINIPNSVTSIGGWAFAFSGLTSITIPNSVTSISGGTFSGCTSLTSITIPNGVTSIGYEAFRGCASLTSVTIPNSVTSIGTYVFSGCTSLTSITIPDSVTSIGNNAFEGCTSLTAINVDSANTAYSSVDGVLYNKDKTTLVMFPAGKTGAFTIPNGVTSIEEFAFYGCINLTSVTITSGVTIIRPSTFSGCTSLTSVTIPNSVYVIGRDAFSGCTSLTSITIPDGVIAIGSSTFSGCTSLTSVTIPASVTSISWGAFANCTSLASVTFQGTISSNEFDTSAFYGLGDLRAKYLDATNGGIGTYTTTKPVPW